MTKYFSGFFLIIASVICLYNPVAVKSQPIETLQSQFTDLRFGAFFHFGIRTFTGGKWGEANQDILKFSPGKLDCNQWAGALVSAGMKFGILTTKHHDGFCLWDSKYTDYDVAGIPWHNGKGDVVREYVDAFRNNNIEPCLYYSIWDNTAGIGNGPITGENMRVIKGQLTELLTNYGSIKLLFIDGWSWKTGHKKVPYDEIRKLVKTLQPGCLLVDNTHLRCLYDNDMIHFEDGSPCPPDNRLPALLSKLIYRNSGNGWFWDPRIPDAELLAAREISDNLDYLEPRWCNLILNLPPNKEGRLDDNIVKRLTEVGKIWQPDLKRPPLPEQKPFMNKPVTPDTAEATSGNAAFAIDGTNDRYSYSVWQTNEPFPQIITIDLGKIYNDINILYYVPKYKPIITPLAEGSIKKYKIYTAEDSMEFRETKSGYWNGDVSMKVITFPPVSARYIKLEVLSAVDGFAAATEIAIGHCSNTK